MSVRCVSLLPAATEFVAVLGAADWLVARSHECDWPLAVTSLPTLTNPKIDASLASGEIDRQLKLSKGGPLFDLDEALLTQLAPELILTQAACQVCAVDADAVTAVAAHITLPSGKSPQVLTLSPQSLDDLFTDIVRVGDAIGRRAEAKAVLEQLKERCEKVKTKTTAAARASSRKPTVAIIEWLDPPMAAGNWVPEMLQLAGGKDALAMPLASRTSAAATRQSTKSHWIDWADVFNADPDVVLLTPCGFKLDRVVAEAKSAAIWPHLVSLRATQEGRLFAVDGHHLFNRPGPRLIDSLELLAERLYPEVFEFDVTQQFSRVLA